MMKKYFVEVYTSRGYHAGPLFGDVKKELAAQGHERMPWLPKAEIERMIKVTEGRDE